jgi:hypothetical protein
VIGKLFAARNATGLLLAGKGVSQIDPEETFAVPVIQRQVSDLDSTGGCNTLKTA